MPTPIGHTLAGALIGSRRPFDWRLFLTTIFVANFPDVDFALGFAVGDPNRYHHGFTHSFVFVLLVAALGSWVYTRKRPNRFTFVYAIFASAGISHLILDVLALDTSAPYGCPLLWPFTNEYFISPITLFSDVHRISDTRQFFPSLLNPHNARTVLLEIVFLTPLLVVVMLKNRWTRGEKSN